LSICRRRNPGTKKAQTRMIARVWASWMARIRFRGFCRFVDACRATRLGMVLRFTSRPCTVPFHCVFH
jgi:hypothetical protein